MRLGTNDFVIKVFHDHLKQKNKQFSEFELL